MEHRNYKYIFTEIISTSSQRWQDKINHTKSKAAGAKRHWMSTDGAEPAILSCSDKEILY